MESVLKSFIIISNFWVIYLLFIRTKLSLKPRTAIFNSVYHLFLTIFYYLYSLNNPADSSLYYEWALSSEFEFAIGTKFITYIVKILVSLGFDYLSLFFIFSIFGLLGIWLLYQSTYENIKDFHNKKSMLLLKLTIFLPNLNFWSVAPGKDSLILFAIGIFFYGVSKPAKRILYIIFGLILIFLIRPHIALFFIVGLSLSILLKNQPKNFSQIIINNIVIIIFALSTFFLSLFIFNWLNLDNFTTLGQYIDNRQNLNTEGGSSIDIAQMNYLFIIISYIYRPLFEFKQGISAFTLFANVDNFILLIMTIYILNTLIKNNSRQRFIKQINLYFMCHTMIFLVSVIPLALTTANLGIAMRQKTMFIYALYSLFVLSCSSLKQNNLSFLQKKYALKQ